MLTYADFLSDDQKDGDVEDLFERSFYLDLVNKACIDDLPSPIEMSDINSNIPRTVASIRNYLEQNPMRDDETSYAHYKPARYFIKTSTHYGKNCQSKPKTHLRKCFEHINQLLK